MARHAKTQALIDESAAILAAGWPMTVRQVYYQLVSRQVIENNRGRYQAVCDALVAARREGIIPWEWIEDRMRQPRYVSMWDDLSAFADDVLRAYRRDVWAGQDGYLECWLEKDALSGVFAEVLDPYGVTLNVGRGYDGWASIRHAADRFGDGDGVTVLYFGDFDSSGEDMVRSLRQRLADLDSEPHIVKVALTYDDIARYDLPPDFTKATDTRRASFVARFGDVAVELDALPADVLRDRLRGVIEARMDLAALAAVRETETRERARLTALLRGAA